MKYENIGKKYVIGIYSIVVTAVLFAGIIATVYASDVNAPEQTSCSNLIVEKDKITLQYDYFHKVKCEDSMSLYIDYLGYVVQEIFKENGITHIVLVKEI